MTKVLHYVSGSFTGATYVALKVLAACRENNCNNILVLSLKRACFNDEVAALQQSGVHVELLVGRQRLSKLVKLYRLLRREKPDVVVCHGYSEHMWGRYAALLARTRGIIHVEHSAREPYNNVKTVVLRWLTMRSYRVICCSKTVQQRLLELGCSEEKCITIENGVDLTPYRCALNINLLNRANNIVMVARFVKRKDHQTLIRAMRVLVENHYPGQLFLAGDGDEVLINECKALAADLGIAHRVVFLGNVDPVADLLLKNQIFVLCSDIEGMPLSICEAMAAGCVVIASDIDGVRNMLNHQQDGILVPPKDPHTLAARILDLEKQATLKIALGQHARERALREFDSEQMLRHYVNEIKCAAKAPGP